LDLYKKYHGPELRGIINQITMNLAILQKVLEGILPAEISNGIGWFSISQAPNHSK
jgi:hypothetical protein